MKTDIIHVDNRGNGRKAALEQSDIVAAYKKLSHKDAMHLRLLTEEMMGMLTSITGEMEADFWIDDETKENDFRLHLMTTTDMNMVKRDKLIAVSSSWKNSAAKGVMGKIRDLFVRSFEPFDDTGEEFYSAGWMYEDANASGVAADLALQMWSFNKYKQSVVPGEPTEEWDELEKSIVANLADEVEIYIRNRQVEMIVYKKTGDTAK